MQDFDATIRKVRIESDRSFKIGGETFTARAFVAPEVMAAWENTDDDTKSQTAQLALMDDLILQFMEPGQEKLWRKVRDPEAAEPLTLGDLIAVTEWLVEQQAQRPTVLPSGSSPSDGRTGTSSKGASSLRAVAGSKA